MRRPRCCQQQAAGITEPAVGLSGWITVIAVGDARAAFAWLNNADILSLRVVLVAATTGFTAKFYALPRVGNLYLTILISALVASVTALLLLPFSGMATAEIALVSSLLPGLGNHSHQRGTRYCPRPHRLRDRPDHLSPGAAAGHSGSAPDSPLDEYAPFRPGRLCHLRGTARVIREIVILVGSIPS